MLAKCDIGKKKILDTTRGDKARIKKLKSIGTQFIYQNICLC